MLIRPGLLTPPVVCLTWADDRAPAGRIVGRQSAADVFRLMVLDALATPGRVIVGANLAYDLGVMSAANPSLLPLIFQAFDQDKFRDVQIRETMLAIAGGDRKGRLVSLQALVERYLGRHLEKADTWRLRYGELVDVPLEEWPAEAREYALADAAVTLEVYVAQAAQNRIAPGELLPTESDQLRAAWALHLMGAWGIRTDPEHTESILADVRAKHSAALEIAREAGFIRKDGSKDMKRIQAAVAQSFTDRGLEVPRTKPSRRFPEGQVSTDADTLEEAQVPGVSDAIHWSKISTSWLEPLSQGYTHPITPRWNVLVDTSRTSCQKPPMQTLPRDADVRPCVKARDGFALVGADYDTVELRALGQVCLDLFGGSRLADVLNAGLDPHLATAAEILGCTYEEILARYQAGEEEAADARQFAKIPNFGNPGGMGADALVAFAWSNYRMRLDTHRARELKAAWLRAYPEMGDYFKTISGWMGPAGEVTIQHPRTGFVRGGTRYTAACNLMFQHLAAQGAKRALYAISRACYAEPESPLYGCRPILFIHDEFILEAPEGRVHEAAEELVRIMIAHMATVIPDVVIKASPVAMRVWHKKAKAVRDSAGRLCVWEPPKKAPAEVAA
jgi:DNA polymerase I-like protein with 3'-5' exonuclease and polymerase domains